MIVNIHDTDGNLLFQFNDANGKPTDQPLSARLIEARSSGATVQIAGFGFAVVDLKREPHRPDILRVTVDPVDDPAAE